MPSVTLEDLFAHCPHTLPFFLTARDAHALAQVTPLLSEDMDTHGARHGFPLAGLFSTFAGRVHQRGHTDSHYPSFSKFFHPTDVCLGNSGGFFVADAGNHCVRHVSREGVVSTVAGGGSSGKTDGKGGVAKFFSPHSLTHDPGSNTLFVCDTDNHCIRAVELAGEGSPHNAATVKTLKIGMLLSSPGGIAFSPSASKLFISDSGHNSLKCVLLTSPEGGKATAISLPCGITLQHPRGLALCGPILYVCDMGNHRVVAFDTQEGGGAWVVAGGNSRGPSGAPLGGHRDGPARTALFKHPRGVCVCPSKRTLYIPDYGNSAVREVDLVRGVVRTLVEKKPLGLDYPQGLCLSKQGALLVADTVANAIRIVL